MPNREQPRQLALNFGSVTAPDFSTDPVGYYVWHLENHPEVYLAFRDLADQYARCNPARQISADMICHVLRYEHDMKAEGDMFAVNNNLTALFARLYARERPAARMSIRKGFLDSLTLREQVQLDTAFKRVQQIGRQGGRP